MILRDHGAFRLRQYLKGVKSTDGESARSILCSRRKRQPIERLHLATPSPAADPSGGRSPAEAAYPEALECVCSSPDWSLAGCSTAGDNSVQQVHDRQSDAAICDNTRLNAYFLGDQTRAAVFGRQQHYLRPLHVALRPARGPAARLKSLGYLRPEPNFSCFGNHPDVESRLTRKEKVAIRMVIVGLRQNYSWLYAPPIREAHHNLNNLSSVTLGKLATRLDSFCRWNVPYRLAALQNCVQSFVAGR
jgi:hypothetical protein